MRMMPASGVTGRGTECPPWHFSPGNFCCPTGKRGARKKNLKGKMWKIESGKEKVWNWAEDPFFFFFFFFFACHFLKRLKLENFTRKSIFHAGKKSGEMTLLPLKNIPVTPLNRNHNNGHILNIHSQKKKKKKCGVFQFLLGDFENLHGAKEKNMITLKSHSKRLLYSFELAPEKVIWQRLFLHIQKSRTYSCEHLEQTVPQCFRIKPWANIQQLWIILKYIFCCQSLTL